MKTIKVDKGDRIHKGQLLAVLTSPELDQQIANARANYNIALITDKRNQILVRSQVIPQQTADESHAAMLQARATLQQDIAYQAYETITAPFDGIVTARYIDPGHLVPASTAPGTPGVRRNHHNLARWLRCACSPMCRRTSRHSSRTATRPRSRRWATRARNFTGTITRHPEALSPDTRTMLVEVDLPNENEVLFPGMYATAEFTVAMGTGSPMVPDDALVFRDGKVYVPVVRKNQLHLAEVTLGYDNGQTVEVLSGINPTDKVAVNVGQAARDGENVQPVENSK